MKFDVQYEGEYEDEGGAGEREQVITNEEIRHLPIPNLKGKDLQRHLHPSQEILKAFKEVGKEGDYEVTSSDRIWKRFYFQVNGSTTLKNQLIRQEISNLIRLKHAGREWLVYEVVLKGKNWKGNEVHAIHMEGKITDGCTDGLPTFYRDIDPRTDRVIPGTTQMLEHKPTYTIPFTKERVNEVAAFLTERHGFSIQEPNGRTYSCSREEFTEIPFDELISLKTGFADYLKGKRPDQFKQGGVR